LKFAGKGIIVGFGLLVVVVVISISVWLLMKPADLILQGEVEATQVQVASKVMGRVDDLHVKKGDQVRKGQLLASIDCPEIRAKLKQAEAARAAALAQKEKAYNGAREEEVRGAMNVWLRAKAASDVAVKTCDRVRRLSRDGIVPAQKLDEAEGQREAALRAESAAKATYEMAKAGARKEDIRSAGALAEQASGVLSEVGAYMGETRVVSPIDGEVADLIPERGELTSPGYPLAVILDLTDVWVTFNVREDLLPGIQVGTVLDARFPALGNRKVGLRVNYISNLGDFAVWRATKASGDFDLKTFEVRAIPTEKLQGIRPGMSAIVNWKKSGTPANGSQQPAAR
jgi:HlyD family secretion protein